CLLVRCILVVFFFFFQAEDGIRDLTVTGVQTCALPISLIYAPGDRHLRWIERLGLLPAVPLVGRGIARTQPLWAEDAADAVLAALERPPAGGGHHRYELAGPQVLAQRDLVRLALAASGRRRRAVP